MNDSNNGAEAGITLLASADDYRLAKLVERFEEWARAAEPHVTEIWFIDRPLACYEVVSRLPGNADTAGLYLAPRPYGIQIHLTKATDEIQFTSPETLALQPFRAQPGIWVVMSDGSFREWQR